MNRIFLYLKNFDWILFSAVFILACIGMMEIYSIALGRGAVDLLNFSKQIFFVGLGVLLLFVFSLIDYRAFKNNGNYIYLLGIVLLLAVLIFGVSVRGTKGWFSLGGFSLQPAEFVKIILIIFLARFFALRATKIRTFQQLIVSGIWSMIIVALVFLQPDLGSALIFLFTWLAMLLITGFNKKYFFTLAIAMAIVSITLWTFSFQPYQKQRILTFLNPSANALTQGYNVTQAVIAVGAGNVWGRGVGFGSQSQLKFLPEAQNDFIFAVIAEELGFLGVFIVIFLYGVFFFRCLANIKKINNDFAIFFILGAVGLIFIEMFINISMNIGILPVVGISLPFVSYGGSSIISTFILVGIIENIVITSKINY